MKYLLILPSLALTLNLKIHLTNLKDKNNSLIALSIHDNKETFPDKAAKAIFSKIIRAKDFPYTIDLAKSSYAISLFEDLNQNKKLDKNILGIPKEAFGFSMNPKVYMSAPAYHKCVFDLKEAKEMIIKMKQFI